MQRGSVRSPFFVVPGCPEQAGIQVDKCLAGQYPEGSG